MGSEKTSANTTDVRCRGRDGHGSRRKIRRANAPGWRNPMEVMNDELLAPIEALCDEEDVSAAESELSAQVETGPLGVLPEMGTESHVAQFIFERENGNL